MPGTPCRGDCKSLPALEWPIYKGWKSKLDLLARLGTFLRPHILTLVFVQKYRKQVYVTLVITAAVAAMAAAAASSRKLSSSLFVSCLVPFPNILQKKAIRWMHFLQTFKAECLSNHKAPLNQTDHEYVSLHCPAVGKSKMSCTKVFYET